MAWLRTVGHKLLHLVRMNAGETETWWEGATLMEGWRCTCGELQGVHEAHVDGDYN